MSKGEREGGREEREGKDRCARPHLIVRDKDELKDED